MGDMFCPNCGTSDQATDTFCRECGNFLPDFAALERKRITPQQHLTASSVLNVMTAAVSAGLAIALYIRFLPDSGTPFIIYLTAGFLTAIFFWQVQVIWRNIQLRKALPKDPSETKVRNTGFQAPKTGPLLPKGNPEEFIAPSVVEDTTRRLGEKMPRRSS